MPECAKCGAHLVTFRVRETQVLMVCEVCHHVEACVTVV